VAIPGYFAPPEVFSLSSQWLGWPLSGKMKSREMEYTHVRVDV
jgi:hypothetical protein